MIVIETDFLLDKCREIPRDRLEKDIILRSAISGSIDKIIDFLRSIEETDGRTTDPSWKDLHNKKNSASHEKSAKALWDIIDNDIPRIRGMIHI